jgi:hypothetical protein
MVVMVGLVFCWALPGCGDDKAEVTQQEPPKPAAQQMAVEEETEEVAEDEEISGEQMDGGEVSSGNTPPVITSAKIMPFPAYTNNDLRVEIEAEDPDSDWINYAYQWIMVPEGGTIEDLKELKGQTGETLSHELFGRGDAIAVKLVPSDWYGEGEEFSSKLVVIADSPPKIVSSPSGASSDSYTYQVKAEDPDGDELFYSLGVESPPSMTIDEKTGLVEWDIGKAEAGDHEVLIQVHDGHGASSYQRFTLTISGAEEMEGEEELEQDLGETEEEGVGRDMEEYGEDEAYEDEFEEGEVTEEGDLSEEYEEYEDYGEEEEIDEW